MKNNLRLVVNNLDKKKFNENHFFEKNELKIILDLYLLHKSVVKVSNEITLILFFIYYSF